MDSSNWRELFPRNTLCKYTAVPFVYIPPASHTAQVGATLSDLIVLLKPDRHFFPAMIFVIFCQLFGSGDSADETALGIQPF